MKRHYKQNRKAASYHEEVKSIHDQGHFFLDYVRNYKSVRNMGKEAILKGKKKSKW